MGSPKICRFLGRAEAQVASMLTRSTVNATLLPNATVTQPYGYRVVPYRVGTTAHIRSIDTFFYVEVMANLNLSAVNYVGYT